MDTTRRLLVLFREDIQLFCSGIAALLQQEATFLVEIRRSVRELPSILLGSRPHLILFFPGHAMPALPVRTINLLRGHTKLLLVYGPDTKWTLRHLQDLEADGVISSRATRSELLLAVHTLLVKNLKYVSPQLIDTLSSSTSCEPWASLSKKEKEIASFITNGKRNIDIATELSISPKTVNTYKVRIYRKLGVSNAVQLLKLWQRGQLREGTWD